MFNECVIVVGVIILWQFKLFSAYFIGAKTSTPNQGIAANICPPGYFCQEGTDYPEPCPAGTYSNIAGELFCFKMLSKFITKHACLHTVYYKISVSFWNKWNS